MAKVYVSAVLDAPIERVWQMVRDFDGLPRWVPAIAASEIVGGGAADRVGCVRALTLAGGGSIKERLLALDETTHTCGYEIVESPLPIANYLSHIRLKPVTTTGRTFIEWSGEYDVLQGDPEDMRKLISEGVYGAGISCLAEFLAGRG